MASGPSTAVSLVLRRHNADLVKAIAAGNLLDFILKLYEEGLIERDTKEKSCLLVYTAEEKACIIVSAVERKVEADPFLFQRFTTLLQSEGDGTLKQLGNKLYEALGTPSRKHSLQSQSYPPPKRYQPHPQFPALHLYTDKLRTFYTQSKLPMYSNPACYKWTPSPSKKYIDLSTIDRKGIKTAQIDEYKRTAVLTGKITSYGSTNGIKIEEILQIKPDENNKSEQLKCILVEGPPGIGKSTLAWQVCNLWGKRELFQQYSLVLLLPLRDQRVQEATCVRDLFISTDVQLQERVRSEVTQEDWDGNATLIILEGLDELPSHLLSRPSIFTGLLSGEILSQATILITSRPSATEHVHKFSRQRISRHFEIRGFTQESINQYAQSVLHHEQLSDFKEYISIHPHIQSMLYVPLHCVIAVTVYLQCQQSRTPPPKTLTGLYTCLTQTILTQYLNDHPQYVGGGYTLDTVFDLHIPHPVHNYFKELCRIAFERFNDQQLIFPDLPKELHDLGFTDAVPEFLLYQQSTNNSYNFLHLSVQEFLAAYHISLLTASEQEELLCTVDRKNYRINMVRFLVGISQFKGLNKAVVRKAIGIGHQHLSMYSLELLYECQDLTILSSTSTYSISIYTEDVSNHELLSLGYCIAKSESKWELKFSLNLESKFDRESMHSDYSDMNAYIDFDVTLLCCELNESNNQNYLITIEKCNQTVPYVLLQYQPEHVILPHIEGLRLNWCNKPLPPSHLLDLIPRMKQLKTLLLKNIPENLLLDLILVLPRVPTLRNLWIKTKSGDLKMVFDKCIDDLAPSFPSTFIINSTLKVTSQFLSQLQQEIIADIESVTVQDIPLSPCPPRLILRMKRLNILMLKNIPDTSLTELVPVLARVTTLRNLTLYKPNSEGVALLCEWLPICQLGKLTVSGGNHPTVDFTFSKNSHHTGTVACCIESECIDLFLKEFQRLKLLILIESMSMYREALNSWTMESLVLPLCLPEVIPSMERLNTLTLENVLESSLTKLIPELSKVPTLKNLTLPKLNSKGIALLCQWLPTCQLERFTINDHCGVDFTLMLSRDKYFIISNRVTTEFINQVILQLQTSGVSLAHVQSMTISNRQLQPLPPCLPKLLPRMENLNTLSLENVPNTSMKGLIPELFEGVPALRKLILPKLNSEGITLLCQWLPTCQLEKLIICEKRDAGFTFPKGEMMVTFRDNSIEEIECEYCTTEFTDQFLSQIPAQSIVYTKKLSMYIKYEGMRTRLRMKMRRRMKRMNMRMKMRIKMGMKMTI